MPGPNDWHNDGGTIKSGLGPDEPSEARRRQMTADAAANAAKAQELAKREAEIKQNATEM